MKSREWQRLVTATVLPAVPDLVLTRGVVHEPDTRWVLRGLARDSSAFSQDFAVLVFAQPLYVPTDHLVFSYGTRLRRVGATSEAWWSPTAAAMPVELVASIRDQALPYLATVRAPSDLLRDAQARATALTDPNILEVITYSAILAGDDAVASNALQAATNLRPPKGWQRAVTDRLVGLGRAWAENPSAGLAQLQAWRDQTAAALGLA